MSRHITFALLNALPSGFITVILSTFFASGTIAESYTDDYWVAPQFLWMIPFWAIFVVIACFKRFFIVGVVFMYLAPFIFLTLIAQFLF